MRGRKPASAANKTGGERRGLIFVISGPSGSGKTTLAEKILKEKSLIGTINKSVSFTTRPKRFGEQDKRDYFFISEEEFKKKRRTKKILEWTSYLGYYYATPKEVIERQIRNGRHILLCVDLKGALKIKRLYPGNTLTIFIMPPSLGELQNRIRKRCSQTREEEVSQRIKLAEKEILTADKFDYCLVNKDLTRTISRLKDIILTNIKKTRGG